MVKRKNVNAFSLFLLTVFRKFTPYILMLSAFHVTRFSCSSIHPQKALSISMSLNLRLSRSNPSKDFYQRTGHQCRVQREICNQNPHAAKASEKVKSIACFWGCFFTQKSSYESIARLMSKSEYTLEEWLSLQKLESLNNEPMHSIFQRVGDKVILNKNRLLSLRPEDMYVWFYPIADQL